MREQLKLEPTKAEKIFLKGQKMALEEEYRLTWEENHEKEKKKVQDLYCMGLNKKQARGANPLSMRRRTPKVIKKDKAKPKKRRLRKGKRSRELSAQNKPASTEPESESEIK